MIFLNTYNMKNDQKRHLVVLIIILLSFDCALGVSVDEVFDPNSGEVYLQRKYVVNVPAKSDECYFIEDVLQGQKLNFHYLVSPL
jgi:hypothetical protein